MTQASQHVARTTQDCEAICVQTIQYCLEMGGNHAAPQHVQLLQDCADICETTTKLGLRSSPQLADIASACATVCDLCAASCERHAGDPQMKACANQCYVCAAACRQVMSSAGRLGEGNFGAGSQGLAGSGGSHQRTP